MAGYGDNRDNGGRNRDHGGGGRDCRGFREYGSGHRGYGSGRGEGSDRGFGGDRRTGSERGYDRGPRRGALICFNCDEPGHYANQCPLPKRNGVPASSAHRGGLSPPGRPSFSRRPQQTDPLESKVAEIGKTVAAVCQFVEVEQQKKAAKERRKAEKKEAEERVKAERAAALLRKQKKEEKIRKEAESKEELHKSLDVRMAVRVSELREDVREDVRQEIRDAIGELCLAVSCVKQKAVEPSETAAESSASSSETEELSMRTRTLCISKKRKQGPDVACEGSPPMELPAKRTPRRAARPGGFAGRLTRAKSRTQKTPTPKKTLPSIRKKTPAAIGIVGRLRFEKRVMKDLKNLDVLVLQNICKDKGIPYNGKFEAIFGIVAKRTQVAYGSDDEEEAVILPGTGTDVEGNVKE
ncbi:hypothetical protein CBR_g23936 [Chara braunii]|uniref:CCHC-type domain-containing protein n=1 Tax=Chara braunii TaxID=69332 RepID=A0A388L589_CHABU|nr:hypothetical protein CBR_g23936 [Chara braunii]|eukprot:GBG77489.1 hypothetical protein CBR_g23936 [Chara braunii]